MIEAAAGNEGVEVALSNAGERDERALKARQDDLELLGLINPHGVIRLWETFARCETMLGGALEDRSMPITSPVA